MVSQSPSSTSLPPAETQTTRPAPTKPAGRPAPAAKPGQPSKAAAAERSVAADVPIEDYSGGSRFWLFNAVPSWLVSMVVHAVVLLVLAIWTVTIETEDLRKVLTVVKNDEVEEIQEFEMEPIEQVDITKEIVDQQLVEMPSNDELVEITELGPANDVDAQAIKIELSPFGEQMAPLNNLMQEIGTVDGTGFSGRGQAQRGKMARAAGANDASEAAVAAALKWLAEHQLADGGWNFDHRGGKCLGRCRQSGSLDSARNGATAMALLPFLGAGQTHKEGDYQKVVEAGLRYLRLNAKLSEGGATFEDGGNMYSHGMCAIVLCEAYGMTHDKDLMAPAQAALNYISYAQDPNGGGWRYSAKMPGDTSVVGWQLMALKSGHLAYLLVPENTVRGAIKFLDSVQSDSGSAYGYTDPGSAPATNSIGLLCRMYTGWKHDHPALQRGVKALSATGPSTSNMYYNYYATQVMRHYEGDEWDAWNVKMRDWLVGTQSKEGHMKGSWYIEGDHGSTVGGRVYSTSMATMILEVYYRHMPIYGKQASTENFPL
jgi:hypothetical protein